jgi:Prokaryotic N-terminal methylation motif
MKSGFTLVELLVVVVIVFLLTHFLFCERCGLSSDSKSAQICKINQKQFIAALLQFKDDHDYRFPAEANSNGGNPFWVGGGIADMPGTLDPKRPLAVYIRDPKIFKCPRDTGTSAFDNPQHCYTSWGTSYLWAAKDIPEVGITGMLGRKYTDPLLSVSSLKIMTFEPPLCATQLPLPKKDQWHGPVPLSTASFLDGHVDMVKQARPKSGPMDVEGLNRLVEEKRPYY